MCVSFNVSFPSCLHPPPKRTHTHKLIHSQGVRKYRQMFWNGNRFYLDFFPLSTWRNVCCSDLFSGNLNAGTAEKVQLWHSARWGREIHNLAFTFLPTLSNSPNILRGVGRVGSVCRQPEPGPPLITVALGHLEVLRQSHVDLSFCCMLLAAGFAPECLQWI